MSENTRDTLIEWSGHIWMATVWLLVIALNGNPLWFLLALPGLILLNCQASHGLTNRSKIAKLHRRWEAEFQASLVKEEAMKRFAEEDKKKEDWMLKRRDVHSSRGKALAIPLLILLTLTACSDRVRPPPIPDGSYFQINPARWQNQVAVRP